MSQKITITITTEGDAFAEAHDAEVARILRAAADRMEETGILPVPTDTNGNVCGSVTVEPL